LPKSPPVFGYGLADAFPGITFDRPVVIVSPPGETNRLFIAEKRGVIWVIPDLRQPQPQIFLDLSAETESRGEEAGFLGLAFHPGYAGNGRLFVCRTTLHSGLRNQLSEFAADPADASRALASSEKIIISQLDGQDTHNAGDVKFGPDGYLYFSNGDETPVGEDVHALPQAIDKGFFAGIFRIDVDFREGNLPPNPHPASTQHYLVPRDNPFVGASEFLSEPVDPARVRTEFFAIGLRNPWRFAFDPATGGLVCADVGGGNFEEINRIDAGGNYGWPYFEASLQMRSDAPDGLRGPVHEYPRGYNAFEGRVVIGGLFYTGQALPGLQGRYLFTDFESGNLRALDLSAANPPQWLAYARYISSFGTDPRDGEVLLADYISGQIHRLIYRDPASSGIPLTLDGVNAFQDLPALRSIEDFLPYEVTTPLWSDGAEKFRWASVAQADGRFGYARTNSWSLPEGAVWIKHFQIEMTNGVPESTRRLETRFLVKGAEGIFGLTYRWDASQTNAQLVPPSGMTEPLLIQDGGVIRTQVWSYPGWGQCQICHNAQAGHALGFNTYQLNREIERENGKTNQLDWLKGHGFFREPRLVQPQAAPKFASLDDESAPLQHRVRSYLDSNCAMCHQPEGAAQRRWDARLSTPFHLAQVLDATPTFHPAPLMIAASRTPTNSFLLHRASVRNLNQMPPLATARVDEDFLLLATNWIMTVPEPVWRSANIGAFVAEGSAEQTGRSFRISGAGAGLAAGSVFSLQQGVSGAVQLGARLLALRGGVKAEAGLWLSDADHAGGAQAAVFARGGEVLFQAREQEGSLRTIGARPLTGASWLKIVRDRGRVSGWVSTDGLAWELLGIAQIDLADEISAGFFAAAGSGGAAFASGEFEDYFLDRLRMLPPAENPVILPAEISLQAIASLDPPSPDVLLAYASGSARLGEAAAGAPFLWKNGRAGIAQVAGVLARAHGSLTSAPVALRLDAPATQAWISEVDQTTLGDWQKIYGLEAAYVPGLALDAAPHISLSVLQGNAMVLGPTSDASGIPRPEGRTAVQLAGAPEIEFALAASDYRVHAGALYLKDWRGSSRPQTIIFSMADGSGPDQTIVMPGWAQGVYLRFAFRNAIRVRITNEFEAAYLGGIFVDEVEPIAVSLLKPAHGAVIQQPAAVEFSAAAFAPGRDIKSVQIFSGDVPLASFAAPPYSIVLSNLASGGHLLKAVAVGTYGVGSESASALVTVLPPAARAEFAGSDTNSQGSWKTSRGSEGFWIIGDEKRLPDYLPDLRPSPDNFYYFGSEFRVKPEALETAAGGSRMAACFYGDSKLSFDLKILDGSTRRFGAYFLDPENFRVLEVRMLDLLAPSNVLSEAVMRDFTGGKYLFWNVRGHTRLEISAQAGNAVVSGLFFDPPAPAYLRWQQQHFTAEEIAALGAGFDQADSDADGAPNVLEYLVGSLPRDASSSPEIFCVMVNGRFEYRVRQAAARADMAVAFERSDDLRNWTRISEGVSLRLGESGGRELFISERASSRARQFFRVTAAR